MAVREDMRNRDTAKLPAGSGQGGADKARSPADGRATSPISPTLHFLALSTAVFGCYLLYAWLQEGIVRQFKEDGFVLGWFLTLVQFIVYASLGSGVMHYQVGRARQVPLTQFVLIGALSVATIGLSNSSCEYLNYPTQVLFKSSKMIPVMAVGVIMLGKRYDLLDVVAVVLLCIGLAAFSLADKAISPSFHPFGMLLISGALAADAVIGNVQEKVMGKHPCHPLEMVVWSKAVGLPLLVVATAATGQMGPGVAYVLQHPQMAVMIVAFGVTGLLGEVFVMALVQHYGALITVTVTSCRKAVTIILSFLLFPKPYTHTYLLAGITFGVGVGLSIYRKNRKDIDALLTSAAASLGLASAPAKQPYARADALSPEEQERLNDPVGDAAGGSAGGKKGIEMV